MRKFMISVNGKSYEVEVEEIGGSQRVAMASAEAPATPQVVPSTNPAVATQTAVSTPAAAPVKPTPQPAATPQPTGSLGSVQVNAPMPGNILDIRVNAGDVIKKGHVVVILEAMKMENEIMAPQDGKITSVNTSKGSTVNSGDLLFTME